MVRRQLSDPDSFEDLRQTVYISVKILSADSYLKISFACEWRQTQAPISLYNLNIKHKSFEFFRLLFQAKKLITC